MKETDATLIARLRDNLEHIAGQLVERTAQLAEAKATAVDVRENVQANLIAAWDQIAALNVQLHKAHRRIEDEMQITALAANARVHRMADRKPWKLIALTAVMAFAVGAVLL